MSGRKQTKRTIKKEEKTRKDYFCVRRMYVCASTFFPRGRVSTWNFLFFPCAFVDGHSSFPHFAQKKVSTGSAIFMPPLFATTVFPRKYLFFFSPQFFLSRSLSKPESSEKGGGGYPSLHRSRKRKGFYVTECIFPCAEYAIKEMGNFLQRKKNRSTHIAVSPQKMTKKFGQKYT